MLEKKEIIQSFAEAVASVSTPSKDQKGANARVDFLTNLLRRIQEAVDKKEASHQVRTSFAMAMSESSRIRRQFRQEIDKKRYKPQSLEEPKRLLSNAWEVSNASGISPAGIIEKPDDIVHSAIAAELAARVAVMLPELRQDPRAIYHEVARAYRSIDWRNLTPEQAAELNTTIENSFKHIRDLANAKKLSNFPPDNDKLWRGLNDYYFSSRVSSDEVQPDPQNSDPAITERNTRRENLRSYLKRVQTDLADPTNTEREERDILKLVGTNLRKGRRDSGEKGFTIEDANRARERLREEDEGYKPSVSRERGVEGEEPPEVALEDLEKRAEEIVQASGGRSKEALGMFYDITKDQAERLFPGDPESQKRLFELQQLFLPRDLTQETFGLGDDTFRAGSGLLDEMLRRRVVPEQREALSRLRLRIESERERLAKQGQPISRFYLTQEEQDSLDKDGIGTIDRMFNQVLEGIIERPEDPITRQRLDRLELMQYYLFSDQYDSRMMRVEIRQSETGDPIMLLPKEQQDALRRRFREKLAGEKDKFGKSFSIRYHAAQWLDQWSNADSAGNENYQRFINSRMNEDDFFGLDGQYGGLIARAREIIRAKFEAKMFKNGERQAYDVQFWDQSVEETMQELAGNKKYRTIYEQYLSGEFFKAEPFSEGVATLAPKDGEGYHMAYEEACKTITNFARIRMMMSNEKDNLDIRFLPPKWGMDFEQIPSTFLQKQKVPKLIRPIEHHMMTWGGLQPGREAYEKAAIRHQANIMRYATPEIDVWAKDRADRYWKRMEQFRSGELTNDQQKHLFGEVNALFYFIPDSRDQPPGLKSVEFGDWLKNLKYEDLLKESQVYSGMQIHQHHMLRPYTVMFESGYRRDSEVRFMNDALQRAYGDDEKRRGIFDAGKVVNSSISYHLNEHYVGNPPEKRAKYVESMAGVAEYRPHSLVIALREGDSRSLEQFEQDKLGGKRFEDVYAPLSMYFDEIRSRLLETLDVQINYYDGPTNAQRDLVLEVFKGHTTTDTEAQQKTIEYFGQMQSLAKYLVGDKRPVPQESHKKPAKFFDKIRDSLKPDQYVPRHGAVEEFADIRYAPLLSKARWDDYPYEWLQYPDRIISALKRSGKVPTDEILHITPVTSKFIGRYAGDEQSGPWRRQHRDLGGAQVAFDQIGPGLDWDDKISLQAHQKMYQVIVSYQGPQHAANSYLLSEGGRLGAQRVYSGYGPLLEGWARSSDLNRYGPPGIKAKSSDELRGELDKVMAATGGKVTMNAPQSAPIFEAVEGYLGISDWRKLLGGYRGFPEKLAENFGRHVRFDKFIDGFNEDHPRGIRGMKLWAIPFFVGGFLLFFALSTSSKKEEER